MDCGITSIDEIKYLKEKNIDVIVSDHHSCGEKIPEAIAVVNPKRNDCDYPCDHISGVGVVFKIIHGICIKLNLGNEYLEYIDIVALGTVADVVSLVGENRIIVKFGIEKMKNTSNIGLKTLIEYSKVDKNDINTYTLAFLLAPLFNAEGRMGDARRAVELFINEDANGALKLVKELTGENERRQKEEQIILSEAMDIIEANSEYLKKKVLVVVKEKWHHGIIGIVAKTFRRYINHALNYQKKMVN